MSFVHGKNTFVSVDGNDLSAYTNTSNLNASADVHQLTTYGKNTHVFGGGLANNQVSLGGSYDNHATTSPRRILLPRRGTTVTLVRRPEGTGTGKPQDTLSAVLTSYVETNPVGGYIEWTAEFQGSDDVTTIDQA